MRKEVLVVSASVLALGLAAAAGMARAAEAEREGGEGRGLRGRGWGRAHIKEALGLTDAQMAQLRKLRSDHMKQAIRQRADMAVARIELHELLDAPAVDEKAVSAKTKELADLHAAALRARVDARLSFRKVLSAEQLEKLRQLRPMGGPRGRMGRHGFMGRLAPGKLGEGPGDEPLAEAEDGPDAGF